MDDEFDQRYEMDFGELSHMLARTYRVPPERVTALHARLKNFHKLGFPPNFKGRQGKAARYSAGDGVALALAMELTQLGLAPERVVRVLSANLYTVGMAIERAARALIASPAGFNANWGATADTVPVPTFIFFDPRTLADMKREPGLGRDAFSSRQDDFFLCADAPMVEDGLRPWTSTTSATRISLVNVTAFLDQLLIADWADVGEALEWRRYMARELLLWVDTLEPTGQDQFLKRLIELSWDAINLTEEVIIPTAKAWAAVISTPQDEIETGLRSMMAEAKQHVSS